MKNCAKKVILFVFLMCTGGSFLVQAQDKIPREYTNPDEVVTFDRSTSFERALDVINQFAQQYADKIIIDRTKTDGNVGITIPPMHWRDALDLILQSKYLKLVEKPKYFEIVRMQSQPVQQGRLEAAAPDTSLSTDSKEVRINAIFFEGSRRALQEVGVDWSTLTERVPENLGQFVNQQQGGGSGGGSGGSGGGGGGQEGQLPDVGNFDGPFVSVNAKGAQSVSQNVFNSLINFGDVFGSGISVQALFSAFQADNLGEILASPSVKVLEGEEGHIQVGQDFSIKQRDFAGNVIDKFFSVGTILNVTPQIVNYRDTTFIHLNIEAERSSAQPDPVSTIINKQNATTQALLLDNEATVIAGLYRTESSEVRRGIPILKDLPPWFFGLRYLFGYNSKDYQTRELVILIQASIEPSIPERMQQDRLPTKLELLEKERNRMQRDIDRYKNATERPELFDKMNADSPKKSERQPEKNKEMKPLKPKKDIKRRKREMPHRSGQSRNVQSNTTNQKELDTPKMISQNKQAFSYYVVGGSFKNKMNAGAMQKDLMQQGYDPQILTEGEDGFYMVAYKGFNERPAAVRFLRKIKDSKNVTAWIYNNY